MKQTWYFSLFKKKFSFMHLFTTLLVGLLLFTFVLLVYQYRQLKEVTTHLCDLKEEYRVYTISLKKMVDDQSIYQSNGADQDEKKKMRGSSPDSYPFTVVNREDDYMLEQSLKLASDHDLGEAVSRLLDEFEWKKRVMPSVKKKVIKRRRVVKEHHRFIAPSEEAPTISKKHTEQQYNDAHFVWPIDRSLFWLSSLFGPRKLKNKNWKFHYGIDMAALKGTPVYAAAGGIVVDSHYSTGYGNSIVIVHNKKYKTRYAHLHTRKVKIGQKVRSGEVIGTVGDTGHVRKSGKDASHLHFEVFVFGKQINPLLVLR